MQALEGPQMGDIEHIKQSTTLWQQQVRIAAIEWHAKPQGRVITTATAAYALGSSAWHGLPGKRKTISKKNYNL
jgi:hypothetical protein